MKLPEIEEVLSLAIHPRLGPVIASSSLTGKPGLTFVDKQMFEAYKQVVLNKEPDNFEEKSMKGYTYSLTRIKHG